MTDEQLIEEREPLGGLVPVGEPRGREEVAGLHVRVPAAGPPHRRGQRRRGPGHAPRTPVPWWPWTRRTAASSSSAARRLPGHALPTALVPNGVIPTTELAESLLRTGEQVAEHGLTDPGAPAPTPAPRISARSGPCCCGRHPATSRATRSSGPERHRSPPPSDSRRTSAGRILAGPGTAGLGQDLHRRPHDRAARDGRAAGRRGRQQPQGHRQPARTGGRGRARSSSSGARSARLVRIGQKPKTDRGPTFGGATALPDNASVTQALRTGARSTWSGPSAWTWCRPEMALPEPVLDVLFVDEAGQMSLANVLACAPAARAIVLLGDPQQLDQPTQGSHPPGAERSALGHILGDRATIEPVGGPVPRRDLAAPPGDLLRSPPPRSTRTACGRSPGWNASGSTGRRAGHGRARRYRDAARPGRRTRATPPTRPRRRRPSWPWSASCSTPGATWTDRHGDEHPVGLDDIVIVAPYNAHVAAIERAFADAGLGDPFVGHGRQVPGPGAPDQHLRDGHVRTRGRTARAWSSCTRSTASTWPRRAPAASRPWSAPRPCSGSPATRRARCSWRTGCAWRSRPPRRRSPAPAWKRGPRRGDLTYRGWRMTAATLSPAALDAARRRSRNTLIAGVALGSTGHIAAVTVATIVAKDLLGSQAFARGAGSHRRPGRRSRRGAAVRAHGAARPTDRPRHRLLRGRDRRPDRHRRGRHALVPAAPARDGAHRLRQRRQPALALRGRRHGPAGATGLRDRPRRLGGDGRLGRRAVAGADRVRLRRRHRAAAARRALPRAGRVRRPGGRCSRS